MTYISIYTLLIAIFIVIIALSSMGVIPRHPQTPMEMPVYSSRALSHSIILVSSLSGPGREIAFKLVEAGGLVLVGVSSEAERKSLMYSSVKGIETVLLDLTDPAQIATAMYRVQELQTGQGRSLVGAVLIDHPEEMNTGQAMDLDVVHLHEQYQQRLQGPVRILQACLEYMNTSNSRVVFVKSLTAENYLHRMVHMGCGIACAFDRTAFELASHQLGDNRVSLVEVPVGQVNHFFSETSPLEIESIEVQEERRAKQRRASRKRTKNKQMKRPLPPSVNAAVTNSVIHALGSPYPHRHYVEGRVAVPLMSPPTVFLSYVLPVFQHMGIIEVSTHTNTSLYMSMKLLHSIDTTLPLSIKQYVFRLAEWVFVKYMPEEEP